MSLLAYRTSLLSSSESKSKTQRVQEITDTIHLNEDIISAPWLQKDIVIMLISDRTKLQSVAGIGGT